MQSPKHGQRVSVACLMSMSGTMCAYVILKYSLSIQNEILGIYILMKFMPPLVALLTTTGKNITKYFKESCWCPMLEICKQIETFLFIT
jgi:hypothetical protein